jgi:hypothetical protein
MKLALFRCISALALASAAITPVAAQISGMVPPPRAISTSPGGVTLQNGSFNLDRSWLAFGTGVVPSAMTFKSLYRSDSDQRVHSLGGRTSHNWDFYLYRTLVDNTTGPNPGDWICAFHVVQGDRSDDFQNVGCGNSGTYDYGDFKGTTLKWDGAAQLWTYTRKDGGTVTFSSASGSLYSQVQLQTEPDGTTFSFGFTGGSLSSVLSNRGIGLVFEHDVNGITKACSVNMASDYVTNGSLCPAGAPTVSLSYTNGYLTSVIDAVGANTIFEYQGGYISCFREPSSAPCKVTNSWVGTEGRVDRVSLQTFADGTTASYGYATTRNPTANDTPANYYNSFINHQTTLTDARASVLTYAFNNGDYLPLPTAVTDPLSRAINLGYGIDSSLVDLKLPEANENVATLDSRMNVVELRQKAKTGSGLADVVAAASYSATCTNIKTCNKPLTTTDARGNVTDFAYDATHGGVTSLVRPAASVGGARPLELTSYTQKFAYVKNASGVLIAAATPVWLVTTRTQCQTVAGSSSPVCDTSVTQRVTTFEYGANGTADNLRIRGEVVIAGGISRRSCFAYDSQGNRIAETTARAGLATCP